MSELPEAPAKAPMEVGYVARAHGIEGEVGVKTFDPQSTALEGVDRVLLRHPDGTSREVQVESLRYTPKETLLFLEGVASRSAAEALRGSTVLVFREDLEEPEEGEYFQGDLVGLTAVDEAGEALGMVAEVWNTGPTPNLVIRAEGKPELIIPFAEEFVPTVDLAAGKVVVRPLEFLE